MSGTARHASSSPNTLRTDTFDSAIPPISPHASSPSTSPNRSIGPPTVSIPPDAEESITSTFASELSCASAGKERSDNVEEEVVENVEEPATVVEVDEANEAVVEREVEVENHEAVLAEDNYTAQQEQVEVEDSQVEAEAEAPPEEAEVPEAVEDDESQQPLEEPVLEKSQMEVEHSATTPDHQVVEETEPNPAMASSSEDMVVAEVEADEVAVKVEQSAVDEQPAEAEAEQAQADEAPEEPQAAPEAAQPREAAARDEIPAQEEEVGQEAPEEDASPPEAEAEDGIASEAEGEELGRAEETTVVVEEHEITTSREVATLLAHEVVIEAAMLEVVQAEQVVEQKREVEDEVTRLARDTIVEQEVEEPEMLVAEEAEVEKVVDDNPPSDEPAQAAVDEAPEPETEENDQVEVVEAPAVGAPAVVVPEQEDSSRDPQRQESEEEILEHEVPVQETVEAEIEQPSEEVAVNNATLVATSILAEVVADDGVDNEDVVAPRSASNDPVETTDLLDTTLLDLLPMPEIKGEVREPSPPEETPFEEPSPDEALPEEDRTDVFLRSFFKPHFSERELQEREDLLMRGMRKSKGLSAPSRCALESLLAQASESSDVRRAKHHLGQFPAVSPRVPTIKVYSGGTRNNYSRPISEKLHDDEGKEQLRSSSLSRCEVPAPAVEPVVEWGPIYGETAHPRGFSPRVSPRQFDWPDTQFANNLHMKKSPQKLSPPQRSRSPKKWSSPRLGLAGTAEATRPNTAPGTTLMYGGAAMSLRRNAASMRAEQEIASQRQQQNICLTSKSYKRPRSSGPPGVVAPGDFRHDGRKDKAEAHKEITANYEAWKVERRKQQKHSEMVNMPMQLMAQNRDALREKTGYTRQGLPDPDDLSLSSLLKRRANERMEARRAKSIREHGLGSKVGRRFVNAAREQEEFFGGSLRIMDMDSFDLKRISKRMADARRGNFVVEVQTDRTCKRECREVRDTARMHKWQKNMEVKLGLRDPAEDALLLPVAPEFLESVAKKNREWLPKKKRLLTQLKTELNESVADVACHFGVVTKTRRKQLRKGALIDFIGATASVGDDQFQESEESRRRKKKEEQRSKAQTKVASFLSASLVSSGGENGKGGDLPATPSRGNGDDDGGQGEGDQRNSSSTKTKTKGKGKAGANSKASTGGTKGAGAMNTQGSAFFGDEDPGTFLKQGLSGRMQKIKREVKDINEGMSILKVSGDVENKASKEVARKGGTSAGASGSGASKGGKQDKLYSTRDPNYYRNNPLTPKILGAGGGTQGDETMGNMLISAVAGAGR
ncbi:unnamed protein product [Amoebophrya sp. A25]|nr:unnamed protein product [Amoebophrya sp. A25]|eukprot:GSA25T00002903001.1